MHDGWQFVAGAYGAVAATLGVWFWMVLAKLRRLRAPVVDRPRAAEDHSTTASREAARG